jgi:hypothetical protein
VLSHAKLAKPRITLDAPSAIDVTCPPAEVDGEGTLQEYSCASMEHRRQGSKVDHVVMGCKQKLACEQDEAQNYSGNLNKGKQQCWNTDPFVFECLYFYACGLFLLRLLGCRGLDIVYIADLIKRTVLDDMLSRLHGRQGVAQRPKIPRTHRIDIHRHLQRRGELQYDHAIVKDA